MVFSGGSRGVSLVSTETPFQIGINFYAVSTAPATGAVDTA